ncbi:hypothetical protein Wxf_00005 [Armadillidium vulgare]|nr:hypothetical protein Wxf_00005 [Armadillidium vulgare] [Wolbachia endosymbiont of Armadillidium vulgare]
MITTTTTRATSTRNLFYDPFQTCLKDLEIFSSYNQKIRKEILIFLYILNQFEFFKRLLDTPFLETFLSATKGEREGEYREGVLETLEKAIENHLKNNRFLEEEEEEEELNFEIEDFVSEEFSILKKKYTFKNSCLEIKNLKNINRGARKLRRGLESNDGIFSPQNSRRRRLPQTLNNNNNNSQSIRLSSNKNYNKMALFKKFQNYESIYNVCLQNVALTNTKLFLQKELGNIFHYPSVDNRVCVNHSSSQFQDCRHCRVLLLGVGSIICLLDGGEKRCNTSTTTISGFFSEPSSSPPPPPSYEKSICVSDGRGKNNGNILFNKFHPSNKIHLVDETFCRIKNFKNDHKKGLSNLKEVKSNNNKANDNNNENDNNNNNALLYRREKGGNFIILATRDTPASCFFVIEKINMETDNWGGKTARHLSSPEDQNNMFYSSQEALDELSASYNIEVSRYSVGDGGSGGGGFENSGMKRKTSDSAMKDDKKVIKIRYLFSPYFFLSSFHFSIKIYQMSDTIKLSFEEFNEKFKNEGIEIPREDQNYLLQNIPFQLFRTFMMKNQRSDNKIIRFKMPNDEYIHFNVEKLKEETGYYLLLSF